MVPFRNFLARKSAASNGGQSESSINTDNDSPTTDSPRSTPLSIKTSNEDRGPPEYKLSVVDDNGSYLPPSPPEKQSFWSRNPSSTRSSKHRNLVNENEPFSISRESFDSYRRSFDISARSPVSYSDTMPSRTSLDSRFSRITSSSATYANGFGKPEAMEEENFEDIGLDDEAKPPKKKGIFSRFGDFANTNDTPSSSNSKGSLPFHLPGRRRGQSGAGSELGAIKSPSTESTVEGQ